jgi:hypothetical protein
MFAVRSICYASLILVTWTTWWEGQITKYLICQFSPSQSYILLLRPSYLPQHAIPVRISDVKEMKCYAVKWTAVNFSIYLCWLCIVVYQYSETNLMHFLFSLLTHCGPVIFFSKFFMDH